MILTMLASDRSTVTPLSPPPHQGARSTVSSKPVCCPGRACRRSQFGLRLMRNRSQQGMGELSPNRRSDLRNLLSWAKPVEPRH